jgi:hypothetical protein
VLRSVLAVLSGYLIYAVPTVVLYAMAGQRPPIDPSTGLFLLGSTVQGIVFAFLGGYVAGWLAPVNDRLHAGVVALIIATAALLQAFSQPQASTSSSALSTLFFFAPSAFLGGVLRSYQDESR